MIHPWRSLGLSTRWALSSLLMFGSSTGAGCGNPGENSVAVSSEARARILPHAGPNAKNAKAQPIAGKPLSAKQLVRQKAASQSD